MTAELASTRQGVVHGLAISRIESVAETAGFSSEEQMRCAFIRIFGIPPREYRNRFVSTV